MMKTRLRYILCVLVALVFVCDIKAQDNVLDEVVWTVGGEPILKSDVEMLRLQSEFNHTPIEGDPYKVIPEELAIQKLFLHQAELDSIEVSPSDVADRVEERFQEMVKQYGSEEVLVEYLNQSVRELKEQLTTWFVDQYKIFNVRSKIIGDYKATPAEVRRYFKNIPEDSLPMVPAQVEVQIITQSPFIPREEVERVKSELMGYAERINKGESFATLARLYSVDGSSRVGGELGFKGRAEWVPEFSAVAFALTNPKTVSKIVKTEYGYHIIQLIERKGDKINCRHILRRPEISDEELNKTLARLDSVSAQIKKGVISFEQAVLLFSEDKDTRNNMGIMVSTDFVTRTQSMRYKLEDLHLQHQDVAKMVERMNVGDVSKAFVMEGNNGMKVCSVIKLRNKIPEHRADITDDFKLLTEIVNEKKSEEIVEEWIKEKIKTTYVSIKDSWKKSGYKYNWLKE
ncbi:MAG: peptidylprolyl isomerase [Bacteroidaceae bacterium]|nr:peptidylprolyl isomerase [Bacteroidaceae bacterium]